MRAKDYLLIGLIAFKISVAVSLIKIEIKLLKCFILTYRTFFIKTNIQTKTIFAKEKETRLLCGMRFVSKKNKYNRVFEGIDIYELASNLQETFEF